MTTNRRTKRWGATALECAFTLPVFLFVLFALLDLGIAAVRFNSLAEASRRIAREAILHGSLAASSVDRWGPATYSGTLADGSPLVAAAGKSIPTMLPGEVQVEVSWPDSDNSPRDRVTVDVRYSHESIVPGLFPWGPLDLRATSTMHIVN